MHKKRMAMVATVGIAALTLAGCAGGGDSSVPQEEDQPSELTVLATDSPSTTALKAIAERYTDETGIEIVFVDVPNTQLATKIILARQAGEASFDIAQLNGPDLPAVVDAAAFLELDEFIDEDEDYDKSDFPQGILDYAKQDDVSYAVPLSTESFLHWYRPDLYEAAGVEAPTTWEGLLDEAPSIQAADQYAFATAYGPTVSATYYAQMLYTSGGRLLDPDTSEPLLTTDTAKTVMERFLELEDFTPSSSLAGASADMVTAFSQQNVASMVAASGWYGSVNSPEDSAVVGQFEIAPPLVSDVGEFPAESPLYGWLLGISPVSTHQQAAWDFLSYALGPDNVQEFIDAEAPPVARTSVTSNEEYAQALPYLPALAESTENATVLPRIAQMPQIITILSQQISAMASGQVSIDEGLQTANDDILDVLVRAQVYTG